ncbi:MAG: hypothetical protein AAFP99_12250 [Pseudomonadota bacterium]
MKRALAIISIVGAGCFGLSGTAFATDIAVDDVQPITFEVGRFVKFVRNYDPDREVFADGALEGEGEACFEIVAVTNEGVSLKHLTGDYQPWWTTETFKAGTFNETFFTSDAYRDDHPEAGVHDQMQRELGYVDRCD